MTSSHQEKPLIHTHQPGNESFYRPQATAPAAQNGGYSTSTANTATQQYMQQYQQYQQYLAAWQGYQQQTQYYQQYQQGYQQPSYGQTTYQQHTVGTGSSFSRELVIQSLPDIIL